MFGDLALAIKRLGEEDPNDLTDEELRDAVVEVARHRHMLEAVEARLTRTFDVRRSWAADDAKSAAAWLARRTRDPKNECASRVKLGRVVQELPLASEAWAAGEIGAAQVRHLARARNARTAEFMARDEAMLVDQARELTFFKFTQAMDYWSLYADPDGADESAMARRERRRVSFDQTLAGMYSGSMLFDPVSGAIVAGELERLEETLFQSDWRDARERLGREPLLHELDRTSDQRRADAMVEMAKRSATMPAGGKAPKPLFTVLAGSQSFAWLCQLSTGRVVSPAELRPWIDDAQLEAILFDRAGTRAMKKSRKRRFKGAVRRVLDVRDQMCTHDYCEEPADRCEGDHIFPWALGGETSQENGRLRCGFHNRLRQRPPPDD